ncbi:chlorophyll synthesis pathway protein BchC [Rubrimonas cliftonensis]|uniref:3-hydroxyethyl bacteriochlorophyllide a dehydrogenase n=1 Tax=Rubrimonas cliftonensis TaxID=89524 RepID=A0A1H4BAJ7_9RHOB|nr:chlorophyll synthesis pathway protein BchC [Rubrimonas cliftonensis]SEA45008.1 3-hydroxyethyl bacteriochlorophyllide a dehydrogenase [Rubrimonas cliftonensis]
MRTTAVVMEKPRSLSVADLALDAPQDGDIVVDIAYSGVSTGTERLLWSGAMPAFPGMGYPLVPGYESVGEVVEAGAGSGFRVGDAVFAPGARCFGPVRGLFGGASQRLVLPGQRAIRVASGLGEQGVLIALAATARHAIAGGRSPDLIIGHGVLGRLIARLTVAAGGDAPTVWETNPDRRAGAMGYDVIDPEADERRDYRAIYDASGAEGVLDQAIARLSRGGEVVLAGFYDRVSFAFPPAFMRETRLRIAAEFTPADIAATRALIEEGFLDLSGLITHHAPATDADAAYRTAFEDAACLKMILDWRAA